VGDWRSSPRVVPPGSLPVASPVEPRAETSRTAAEPNARLERMVLLLKPSPAQQQALLEELEAVQNPASAKFHKWLTAAEFADAYANSASDVAAVSAWLASQGLDVAALPAGRGWIEFSGTVAEVEQAFGTRVDAIAGVGGTRYVLGEGIAVPAALTPLVEGLVSLDGALSAPALTRPAVVGLTVAELAASQASSGTEYAPMTPRQAAGLLHLDTLRAAGTDGAGQTVAIAARSRVRVADVDAFRAAFGLPAGAETIIRSQRDEAAGELEPGRNASRDAVADADSGVAADEAEATLAASWVGVAAPGAHVIVVPVESTGATDGIDLSLAAIVDQRLAGAVAVGYSVCEAALTPAHQAFYATLYRQAAAEGISVVAAAGDSGSAACHLAGGATPVSSGLGVNGLASTPWETVVGVASVKGGSSRIGTGSEAALAAWSLAGAAGASGAAELAADYAGGGGSSLLYAEPAWQPIPSALQEGAAAAKEDREAPDALRGRLLPDLALPTAASVLGSTREEGLTFCLGSSAAHGGCRLMRSGGSGAAAALFAGVAALIGQRDGPQGNLAPRLYALSRRSGVFADVQEGSAELACEEGTQGCGLDGLIGYAAGPGYDRATGLGVVDAHNLVTEWAKPLANGSSAATVTLAVTPVAQNSTYNPTASVTLTATVVTGTGGVTPTGTVQFIDSSEGQPVSSSPSSLNTSGVATLTTEGVFGPGGNEIVAIYSGDSVYASEDSSPPVNVNIQASTTSMAVAPSATSVAPGQAITVTATMSVGSPAEGTVPPAGSVTLDMDGLPTAMASLATAAGVTTATFSVTIPTSSTLATHALQAVYAGNANYAASTSPPVSVTVALSPTTTTIKPASTTPSAGSPLTVSASIASSEPVTANPTGTVDFLLDGVSQGMIAVTAGAPSTASVTIPSFPAGTHVLTGTYSGDASYATSTSAGVTVTAAKGATITTVTATPAKLAVGTTETLTATVGPALPVTGTTYTLTGSVNFYDGTTLLGSAALASNAASLTGVSLSAAATHTITAVYSGDTNWVTSTSTPLVLAATIMPDTVVLTSNLSSGSSGQAIVLTATVTPSVTVPAAAEQNPTGSVIFYDGTTIIGTATLLATPLTNASTATITIQTLPGGQDQLTAVYSGDTAYGSATSNVLSLDVQNFSITPSSSNPGTNLNIAQGTAGTASFTVTGLGGFNNQIQVVCAVPTQDNMTCTQSPQQVTAPATVTFTVQTYLPGEQIPVTTVSQKGPGNRPGGWQRTAGGTALAVLGLFLLPMGRRARLLKSGRRVWIMLLLLIGLGSAGIGCTSDSATNPQGTPLGVATLQITATAYIDNTVVSHSVYLTVNVVAPIKN
jgi:hypothetical protein